MFVFKLKFLKKINQNKINFILKELNYYQNIILIKYLISIELLKRLINHGFKLESIYILIKFYFSNFIFISIL